jgi:shikimate dehydrogenase
MPPLLTRADLQSWSQPGPSFAVLGYPIAHSLSPAMHNAALAQLAASDPRFASWHYYKFEVAPEELPAALQELRSCGFAGLNLTVPHKVIAVDLVASLEDHARSIGAVNTLIARPGGWHGANTDGYGLAQGLREDLGLELAGASVLLLGAGGAARGAAVECLARGVASLAIANRTAANLDALLAALRPLAAPATTLSGFDPSAPPASLPPGTLVINATSAGLKPSDPPPLDLSRIPAPRAVYDMIYNPPLTPLLRQAATLGIPHANGLSMLIHQGAKSLSLWTGVSTIQLSPSMSATARRS